MNRLSAIVIVCGVVSSASAQPVEWRVSDGGNGHWYEFAGVSLCFAGARQFAEGRGGYLVTIGSAQEQQFLEARSLERADFGDFFIGGYQPLGSEEPAGGWRWVDDTAWGFTNWLDNEPNDSGSPEPNDQQALEINLRPEFGASFGKWSDESECAAGGGQRFIIEYSADCNGDGLVDIGQILSGALPDANEDGIPDGVTITTQPVDQTVASGVPVTFFVEADATPGCDTPVTFQWQRRDPAVLDPGDPSAWRDIADGGAFVNARTAAFVITHPAQGLATGYRCVLSGGCGCVDGGGRLYTREVNFALACPTDFNGDGFVDFFDYDDFVAAFESGC